MALVKQTDFYGKRAHIIGMARSGLAAAEVLTALGAQVTMHDRKESGELADAMKRAVELGLGTRVGEEAYEGISAADVVITSPGVPETCPGLVTARLRHRLAGR